MCQVLSWFISSNNGYSENFLKDTNIAMTKGKYNERYLVMPIFKCKFSNIYFPSKSFYFNYFTNMSYIFNINIFNFK